MLTVEVQSVPPAVMLVCTGRIVLGLEAETLRCMLMGRQEKYLFLDLQQVKTMDAAGLGLLVSLYRWAAERNRVVAIMHASLRVRQLIGMTNLRSVLQLEEGEYGDRSFYEDEAAESQAMSA